MDKASHLLVLPVLIFVDDDRIGARAIELNVVAYGPTEAEALEALERAVILQLAPPSSADTPIPEF